MSDTSRGPADTARGTQDAAARTPPRSASRATLQPSVHDFNGNIINKAADEDHLVWLVGKHQLKQAGGGPAAGDCGGGGAFPVHPGLRRGGAFSPVSQYWDSARPPYLTATSLQADRVSAWTEEVHRRHVTRTARARSRLSPKPRGGMAGERVVAMPAGGRAGGGGVGVYPRMDSSECSFSLSLPNNSTDTLEDVRLSSFSRASSRTDTLMTSRSRPATTGRYFDSSNGLRNIRASPSVFRSRPTTANPWAGPGLKIKKVTLHQKELMT